MAVYNESIIDDQLERLDNMYHSGGLTKDQYEKQRANWEKRRARYDYNVKREKEEEAAKKKKEREEEAAQKKKDKAAERRKAQIERTLISTGAQVLKRGLFNTLFK